MRAKLLVAVALVLAASGCASDSARVALVTPAPTAAPTLAPVSAPTASPVPRSAIDPENRPTPIPGRENGLLTAGDLAQVIGECLLARAAAPSLWRLFVLARTSGIALSPGDCYRPRADQVAVRTQSCTKGNCACAGKPGGSMHGWGKAVDLHDQSGSVTAFDSLTYRWLKANAGTYGWTHGRWADPGGGPCPEAWHWEWVGDGGRMKGAPIRADVTALVATDRGYMVVTGLGATEGPGATSSTSTSPSKVVVAAAGTPDARGHWLLTADGTVNAFGSARPVTAPAGRPGDATAMAPTPQGDGLWIARAGGEVVGYGSASPLGSAGRPVTSMAATPSGRGYWLLTADGEVLAFGDAPRLGSPVTPSLAMAATASGRGYWIATVSGWVIGYGDAAPLGSPETTAVAIAPTRSGKGYWTVAADGTVSSFGDARRS
jgi:hypothetical protein